MFFAKPNRTIQSPTDLRPITLLNGLLKIVEVLYSFRIERELAELDFFSPIQFAYQKNRSTGDAVQKVINDMKRAKRFKYAAVICLDASAAFDSINWSIIIDNLAKSGTSSTCIRMCQDLLTGRTVKLNQKEYETQRGTPQGGCASPLLWRIGTNELADKLSKQNRARSSQFADGIAMVVHGSNEIEFKSSLDQAVRVVREWCDRAERKLNASKTEAMSIGKKRIENVQIEANEIKLNTKLKYLG